MVDINSSIEKMSLTSSTAATTDAATTATTTSTAATTMADERRGSDWTEGYGSMSIKSDQASSRRGSELSTLSQVSYNLQPLRSFHSEGGGEKKSKTLH